MGSTSGGLVAMNGLWALVAMGGLRVLVAMHALKGQKLLAQGSALGLNSVFMFAL